MADWNQPDDFDVARAAAARGRQANPQGFVGDARTFVRDNVLDPLLGAQGRERAVAGFRAAGSRMRGAFTGPAMRAAVPLAVIGAGVDILSNLDSEESMPQKVGEAAGTAGGAWLGGVLGAPFGGPVGSIAGAALLGGLGGKIGGGIGGAMEGPEDRSMRLARIQRENTGLDFDQRYDQETRQLERTLDFKGRDLALMEPYMNREVQRVRALEHSRADNMAYLQGLTGLLNSSASQAANSAAARIAMASTAV